MDRDPGAEGRCEVTDLGRGFLAGSVFLGAYAYGLGFHEGSFLGSRYTLGFRAVVVAILVPRRTGRLEDSLALGFNP